MGQKTNPNILRVGKLKEWESKYTEKKSTESSVMIFRDLEIKKFILQMFSKNGLKVQNCKIYYSENSLHIYISYYNTTKPILLLDKVVMKPAKLISTLFKKKLQASKKLQQKKSCI